MCSSDLAAEIDPEQLEADQAAEQWLRTVPDDPAGLLRRKFRYESSRRRAEEDHSDEEAW